VLQGIRGPLNSIQTLAPAGRITRICIDSRLSGSLRPHDHPHQTAVRSWCRHPRAQCLDHFLWRESIVRSQKQTSAWPSGPWTIRPRAYPWPAAEIFWFLSGTSRIPCQYTAFRGNGSFPAAQDVIEEYSGENEAETEGQQDKL